MRGGREPRPEREELGVAVLGLREQRSEVEGREVRVLGSGEGGERSGAREGEDQHESREGPQPRILDPPRGARLEWPGRLRMGRGGSVAIAPLAPHARERTVAGPDGCNGVERRSAVRAADGGYPGFGATCLFRPARISASDLTSPPCSRMNISALARAENASTLGWQRS